MGWATRLRSAGLVVRIYLRPQFRSLSITLHSVLYSLLTALPLRIEKKPKHRRTILQ